MCPIHIPATRGGSVPWRRRWRTAGVAAAHCRGGRRRSGVSQCRRRYSKRGLKGRQSWAGGAAPGGKTSAAAYLGREGGDCSGSSQIRGSGTTGGGEGSRGRRRAGTGRPSGGAEPKQRPAVLLTLGEDGRRRHAP
jgi:hypothetical protein